MITDYVRDTAATAAIFGFFAAAWFGWAQDDPPAGWGPLLLTGSIGSMVIAAVGGLLTWRLWSETTAFDEDTSRAFGIVVGIEFGLAALGAVLLAVLKRSELIPPWVALIVGLHLFPVAVLLEYPLVHVVAAAVTVIAIAAVPVAGRWSIPVSAATGAPAGTVLLAAALVSLVAAVARAG
ncbi:hypothetical protein [Virgisporangium aurantiacum]|uniref:Uncharacterized protein n=1 Tax=Virgisporangium aurantiacum TaxID=175570 RepID=A0A8J4E4B8_9ACTN|nr:hypothetical protein [Virgisporangium aurantiacum]GIJ60909.1 hypothetical protein Vau01_084250 [Virgisporangium aurantiacum]